MSLAAGERAAARLLQQRSFSAMSSAQFSGPQSPTSVAARYWRPSRGSASYQSQSHATENYAEDSASASKTKEEHVDKALLRFLVGKGGSVKAKLEKDFGVELSIPSSYEARTSPSVAQKVSCVVPAYPSNNTSATSSSQEINTPSIEDTDTQVVEIVTAMLLQMRAVLDRILFLLKNNLDAAVINGSESSIKAASIAIQKILDDAVQSKLQYTHFISLPLALNPTLLEQVETFQKSTLNSLHSSSHGGESSSGSEEDFDCTGIHKSIFIRPATIHLTILMLKLWNEERVQAASDVLQRIRPFVHETLEEQPVTVNLQGLECLRGTPEKAHVLYAEVKDSKHKGRLLQACQVLIDAFVESGLVLERDVGQGLKLHATLMNTTQRKKKKNDWSSKRVPFDARNILEKYGNWNWGEYTIVEAHLSERFVYDDNGYYHCVNAIPFPSHAT